MSLHPALSLESLVNGTLDAMVGGKGLVGRAGPSHLLSQNAGAHRMLGEGLEWLVMKCGLSVVTGALKGF